jgi:hypothetical protein
LWSQFFRSILSDERIGFSYEYASVSLYTNQSHSYVKANGQLASPHWFHASVWGPRPDFYYYQIAADLLMWDSLSEEKTDLSFTTAAGPRQSSHIRVHTLLSQIGDTPNLEGQVPLFISSRNWVAQLYFQALGSFSSPPTTRRATVEVLEPGST